MSATGLSQSSSSTITVRVRLFAVLRERAGRDEIELELREGTTAAEALGQLARQPELDGFFERMPMRLAVNRRIADEDATIGEGDELAAIPPVSGGARLHARVTGTPLSTELIAGAVRDPRAGAIVVFEGVTREVDRLEYEAYREMAEEKIGEILAGCVERHDLLGAAAEHRVGDVPLGEPAVVVAVSAAHRDEAFAAAREAIDAIKAEAPIWKREVEGTRAHWAAGTAVTAGAAERR